MKYNSKLLQRSDNFYHPRQVEEVELNITPAAVSCGSELTVFLGISIGDKLELLAPCSANHVLCFTEIWIIILSVDILLLH